MASERLRTWREIGYPAESRAAPPPEKFHPTNPREAAHLTCSKMAEITNYHSLACTLLSITGFEHDNRHVFPAKIAQQLQSASPDEQPVLAQILAELLQKHEDKYSETILSTFAKELVSSTETVVSDEGVHAKLKLAAKLGIARADIFEGFLGEAENAISSLIAVAAKAHVSSDDAFEPTFEGFLTKHRSSILKDIATESSPEEIVELHRRASTYLRFLKVLLLTCNDLQNSSVAVRLSQALPAEALFALVGLRNKSISEKACQVFRLFLGAVDWALRDEELEMLWDGIRLLLQSPPHADPAFSIWLTWVSTTKNAPPQSLFEKEEYWSFLQTGLATGFSERRKFTLHVLMSSLRLITAPVSNRLLVYNPARRKQLESSWAKYSTIIEIISLSTSTNQLKAAVPEVKRFLNPRSEISPSWVVVLVKLGLQATSAPLQKVVWEMLLSLSAPEVERLVAEIEGMEFITDIFLPYAATAHHFVVRQNRPDVCEHGKSLAEFLQKVVQIAPNASAVLSFLHKKADTIFSPARVYVLKGVLDGVLHRNVWGPNEVDEIVGVARMNRFTKMKTDICHIMCLHLLFSAKEEVEVNRLLDAVVDIIVGKEYLLSYRYIQFLFKHILRRMQTLENMSRFIWREFLNSTTALKNTPEPPVKAILLPIVILCISDHIDFDRKDEETTALIEDGLCNMRACDINVRIRFLTMFLDMRGSAGALEVFSIMENNLLGIIDRKDPLSPPHTNFHELAILLEKLSLHKVSNPGAGLEPICEHIVHEYSKVEELWRKSRSLDLKGEESIANLVAAWGVFLRFLDDPNHKGRVLLPDLDGLLAKIDAFPLPVLGQNKHDNVEAMKVTNKFLRASFEMIGYRLNLGQITPESINGFFDTVLRLLRYIESKTLLIVFTCSRMIFTQAPETICEWPRLDVLLEALWNVANGTRITANPKSVYTAFITTAFHVSILKASLQRGEVAQVLSQIAEDILRLSTGKRSIGPAFARALKDAYESEAEVFSSCKWVEPVLRGFIDAMPNRDLDFVNEMPLARLFEELGGDKDYYSEYHGQEEVFALAYVFDILSRLDPNSPAEKKLALKLRDNTFEPWTRNKPGMPIYSKWKKTSQLQALLVVERFLSAEEASGFIEKVIETLRHEPHPRYRFMFEWIISLCILRFREHRNVLWERIQGFDKPNPKLQASLLRVALMVARELEGEMREEYYSELVYTVVPLTSNNKVNVRHQAISMVLELWDDAVELNFASLTNNPLLQRMRQSILNSPYYKEFGAEKDVRTFNAVSNFSLSGIFSGAYLSTKADEVELELIPLSIFKKLSAPSISENKPRFIPLGTEIPELTTGKIEFTKSEQAALVSEFAPLQTKSGTWDAKTFISALHQGRGSTTGPDIIVVASLIENAYNLGGISRVSEIMGVSSLTVHSKDVLKSTDFTSVSVNSEVWLPIVEVSAKDVSGFIREKRAEGYHAVGIEQTNRSFVLGGGGFAFRRKTVLVLGSEKWGIPPELLNELDSCVEIEQVGETRSMNVQTAAAVVLWEVWRQLRVGGDGHD
ncbi:hypothetical protein RUND412_006375 [Rhizina undulata]